MIFANVFIKSLMGHLVGDFLLQNHWMQRKRQSGFVCLSHVLIWTISIWLFTGLPPSALLALGGSHFLIDRFGLAKRYSRAVKKTDLPWLVIVVDQCLHILTLYAIALLASIYR